LPARNSLESIWHRHRQGDGLAEHRHPQKKKAANHSSSFSGPAQELATKRGVTSALITLSHTEHHAVACVVLEAHVTWFALRIKRTPSPDFSGEGVVV